MAKPRMIQGQFGSITYSSGIMDAGVALPVSPSVSFNETTGNYQGVKRHNDVFYEHTVGNPLDPIGQHFATYQYVDLRDLMEEKAAMDDVTINIQRLYELPYPNNSYNVAPGMVEETLMIGLGDLRLDEVGSFVVQKAPRAGFVPLKVDGDGGLPFEVLYREVRQYSVDQSEVFTSPDQIGSFAGAAGDPAQAPTRWVGNYKLLSRTIGGYPDLLVGPGITIVRAFNVWNAARTIQSINGTNPNDAPADEFTFLESRVELQIPALQYNIVGTQRPLTATETATYYSNILLN